MLSLRIIKKLFKKNESKWFPWSSRINFIPFRILRGPLFHKPVTGQELVFAVSYSKPALKTDVALVFTNNVNNTLAKWSGLELLLFFCWVHDMKYLLYSRAEISPSWSKWMKPHFWVEILRGQQIKLKKSNITEEIQVSRRASDRGSYAKPLLVQALSSHLRV